MALIVEDGTGRPDAESYASSAEADAYHLARGNTDWAAVADKEAALRRATDYMTQNYRMRWKSFRVTTTQKLDWPRAYVELPDAPYGYGSMMAYYPNNVVPSEVKSACIELALVAAAQDLNPNLTRAAKQETIGPITVVYDDSSPEYARFRRVDQLLLPMLAQSGGMMRLQRA